MQEKDLKVRNFKCKCGKSRLLSVMDGSPLSKEQKKEQKLLKQLKPIKPNSELIDSEIMRGLLNYLTFKKVKTS